MRQNSKTICMYADDFIAGFQYQREAEAYYALACLIKSEGYYEEPYEENCTYSSE